MVVSGAAPAGREPLNVVHRHLWFETLVPRLLTADDIRVAVRRKPPISEVSLSTIRYSYESFLVSGWGCVCLPRTGRSPKREARDKGMDQGSNWDCSCYQVTVTGDVALDC